MQRNVQPELLYTRSFNRPGYRSEMEYQTYCPKLIHMCAIDNQKNHEVEAIDEYGINIAIAYAINEHGIGPMRVRQLDESTDDEALQCKRAKLDRQISKTHRSVQREKSLMRNSVELHQLEGAYKCTNKTSLDGRVCKKLMKSTTSSSSTSMTTPVRPVDHVIDNDDKDDDDSDDTDDDDDDGDDGIWGSDDISDIEFLNEAVSYAIINRGLSTTTSATTCNISDPSDETLRRNSSS